MIDIQCFSIQWLTYNTFTPLIQIQCISIQCSTYNTIHSNDPDPMHLNPMLNV